MHINKVEAVILSASLEEHKYKLAEMGRMKEDAHLIINVLNDLIEKLNNESADERMIGRTSDTSAYNRIKRYLLRKNKKIKF